MRICFKFLLLACFALTQVLLAENAHSNFRSWICDQTARYILYASPNGELTNAGEWRYRSTLYLPADVDSETKAVESARLLLSERNLAKFPKQGIGPGVVQYLENNKCKLVQGLRVLEDRLKSNKFLCGIHSSEKFECCNFIEVDGKSYSEWPNPKKAFQREITEKGFRQSECNVLDDTPTPVL